MDLWEIEIKRFDEDLKARMAVITRFESCSLSVRVEANLVKSALGYSVRTRYGRPLYFDHTKQWRERNRDRVNELGRLQQKKWRLNNLEKARARDKRYYLEGKKNETYSLTYSLEILFYLKYKTIVETIVLVNPLFMVVCWL